MVKKKFKPMMLCLLVIMVVLAGCTGSGGNGTSTETTSTTSSTTTPTSAPKEEVVINFWGPHGFLQNENFPGVKMINEFNEKYAGQIRVELRYMPHSEYNTAMQAAFTSGDVPDLFLVPGGMDVRTVVANGFVRPIDDIVSEGWKSNYCDGCFLEGVNVIEGSTYTWPVFGPQMRSMLYINKDVLANAGLDPEQPPKSWAEFREMAKVVTEQGNGDIYGTVFGGSDTNNSYQEMIIGLSNTISPEGVFDYKEARYNYDNAGFTEAAAYLKELKNDGTVLPSSYTMKEAEASALFAAGKAAFMIGPRWIVQQIQSNNPDVNFGLSFTPQKDGQAPTYTYAAAQNNGFVVYANTKHAEEVGIFIEEGIGSVAFYEKFINHPIALSPMPAVNANTELYPFPQFETFAQLHDKHLVIAPEPVNKNPEVATVIVEMGGMNQSDVKPNFGEIIQMYMLDSEDDIAAALKNYNDKMNAGLDNGIAKVNEKGVSVSRDDFRFEDWNPVENYLK